MTQVQASIQLLASLLFQARVDPLWQRYLAQHLLHLRHTLAVLRKFGIGIGQGILQVPHEVALQLPLPGELLLPLPGHPVLDPFGAAALAVLQHSINPKCSHLLFAARRRGVHGIDHTAGQGWQETPGEQAQVGLIDARANGAPLIQAKVGNTRPRGTIVAKHRHGIAYLVQRLQQVAPGGVQTLVHFVMTVLSTLGKHVGGLGAIDVKVALPTGDSDTEGQHAYCRTNPEQPTFVARYLDVVPGKAGLLVDDSPEGVLNEVDQRLPLRLAFTQRKLGLVRLCRLTHERIEHVALLQDRRPVHATYQGRRGEAVTCEGFLQEIQQYRTQPDQLGMQREQANTQWRTAQYIEPIHYLFKQLTDQPVVMIAIFIQPGIERADRIQFEGEAQHVFPHGGGKPGVQLIETVQQIEFGQDHIQRQARARLTAHFIQTRAQHMCQGDTLLRRAMQ